jgi:succinoglycan biosynthesis transport protein ExoP
MELRQYYEMVRKRAWIVAVLVAVTVTAVVLQTRGMRPLYRAEVSLLVTPRIVAPTAYEDPNLAPLSGVFRETVLRNVTLMITSKTVLQRVAAQVGTTPRVKVTQIRGSDFLVVSAVDEQPARAAQTANAVAREFERFYSEVNRADATRTRRFIEEQLEQSRARLAAAERALLEFKSRTRFVGSSEEISRKVQRVFDLQAAHDGALLDERLARTRAEAIRAQLNARNDGRLAAVSIATNPVVVQVRDHLTNLELELAGLRNVYTDEHPRVQAVVARIAEAQRRLRLEAERAVRDQSLGMSPLREQFLREMLGADIDAVVARARATATARLLRETQAALTGVPQNEMTLGRLQRDVRVAETTYVRLAALHQEAVIRESRAQSSAQAVIAVVDGADVPTEPESAQLPVKVGLAGFVGLLLGATLAVFAESLDNKIRTPHEAEGAFGVPVLTAVPVMNNSTYRSLTVAPSLSSFILPILVVLALVAVGAAFVARGQAGVLNFGWQLIYGSMATAGGHVVRLGQGILQSLSTVL